MHVCTHLPLKNVVVQFANNACARDFRLFLRPKHASRLFLEKRFHDMICSSSFHDMICSSNIKFQKAFEQRNMDRAREGLLCLTRIHRGTETEKEVLG